MTREEDFDILADELALDDALVRVQSVYPYDSWRGAELRDVLGAALGRSSRHQRE